MEYNHVGTDTRASPKVLQESNIPRTNDKLDAQRRTSDPWTDHSDGYIRDIFECSLCNQKFVTKFHLLHHIMAAHDRDFSVTNVQKRRHPEEDESENTYPVKKHITEDTCKSRFKDSFKYGEGQRSSESERFVEADSTGVISPDSTFDINSNKEKNVTASSEIENLLVSSSEDSVIPATSQYSDCQKDNIFTSDVAGKTTHVSTKLQSPHQEAYQTPLTDGKLVSLLDTNPMATLLQTFKEGMDNENSLGKVGKLKDFSVQEDQMTLGVGEVANLKKETDSTHSSLQPPAIAKLLFDPELDTSRSVTEIYQCSVCQKEFRQSGNFKKHMKTHTENAEKSSVCRCGVCGMEFEKGEFLQIHMRAQHTGANPYKCQHCDREFGQYNNLRRHLRVHREKVYKCKLCDRQFNEEFYLTMHMGTHTGSRTYTCGVCSTSFPSSQDLKIHVKTHSPSELHVCDVCGKGFSKACVLRQHKKGHSGQRPFKCEHCSKTFVHRHHLTMHMRSHVEMKPYYCSYCSKEFTQTSHLYKHLKQHEEEAKLKNNIEDQKPSATSAPSIPPEHEMLLQQNTSDSSIMLKGGNSEDFASNLQNEILSDLRENSKSWKETDFPPTSFSSKDHMSQPSQVPKNLPKISSNDNQSPSQNSFSAHSQGHVPLYSQSVTVSLPQLSHSTAARQHLFKSPSSSSESSQTTKSQTSLHHDTSDHHYSSHNDYQVPDHTEKVIIPKRRRSQPSVHRKANNKDKENSDQLMPRMGIPLPVVPGVPIPMLQPNMMMPNFGRLPVPPNVDLGSSVEEQLFQQGYAQALANINMQAFYNNMFMSSYFSKHLAAAGSLTPIPTELNQTSPCPRMAVKIESVDKEIHEPSAQSPNTQPDKLKLADAEKNTSISGQQFGVLLKMHEEKNVDTDDRVGTMVHPGKDYKKSLFGSEGTCTQKENVPIPNVAAVSGHSGLPSKSGRRGQQDGSQSYDIPTPPQQNEKKMDLNNTQKLAKKLMRHFENDSGEKKVGTSPLSNTAINIPYLQTSIWDLKEKDEQQFVQQIKKIKGFQQLGKELSNSSSDGSRNGHLGNTKVYDMERSVINEDRAPLDIQTKEQVYGIGKASGQIEEFGLNPFGESSKSSRHPDSSMQQSSFTKELDLSVQSGTHGTQSVISTSGNNQGLGTDFGMESNRSSEEQLHVAVDMSMDSSIHKDPSQYSSRYAHHTILPLVNPEFPGCQQKQSVHSTSHPLDLHNYKQTMQHNEDKEIGVSTRNSHSSEQTTVPYHISEQSTVAAGDNCGLPNGNGQHGLRTLDLSAVGHEGQGTVSRYILHKDFAEPEDLSNKKSQQNSSFTDENSHPLNYSHNSSESAERPSNGFPDLYRFSRHVKQSSTNQESQLTSRNMEVCSNQYHQYHQNNGNQHHQNRGNEHHQNIGNQHHPNTGNQYYQTLGVLPSFATQFEGHHQTDKSSLFNKNDLPVTSSSQQEERDVPVVSAPEMSTEVTKTRQTNDQRVEESKSMDMEADTFIDVVNREEDSFGSGLDHQIDQGQCGGAQSVNSQDLFEGTVHGTRENHVTSSSEYGLVENPLENKDQIPAASYKLENISSTVPIKTEEEDSRQSSDNTGNITVPMENQGKRYSLFKGLYSKECKDETVTINMHYYKGLKRSSDFEEREETEEEDDDGNDSLVIDMERSAVSECDQSATTEGRSCLSHAANEAELPSSSCLDLSKSGKIDTSGMASVNNVYQNEVGLKSLRTEIEQSDVQPESITSLQKVTFIKEDDAKDSLKKKEDMSEEMKLLEEQIYDTKEQIQRDIFDKAEELENLAQKYTEMDDSGHAIATDGAKSTDYDSALEGSVVSITKQDGSVCLSFGSPNSEDQDCLSSFDVTDMKEAEEPIDSLDNHVLDLSTSNVKLLKERTDQDFCHNYVGNIVLNLSVRSPQREVFDLSKESQYKSSSDTSHPESEIFPRCKTCCVVCKDEQELSRHLIMNHNCYISYFRDSLGGDKFDQTLSESARSSEASVKNYTNIFATQNTDNGTLSDDGGQEVSEFKCKFCNQTFEQVFHLQCHILQQHSHLSEDVHTTDIKQSELSHVVHNPQITVDSSRKKSSSRTKSSAKERTYSCQICGEKFKQTKFLKDHYETHTGQKPFKCDVCSRGFTHKHNLNRHMMSHNSKNFECRVCGRTFKETFYLQMHMKIHVEKSQQCEICGENITKLALWDHMLGHLGSSEQNPTYKQIGARVKEILKEQNSATRDATLMYINEQLKKKTDPDKKALSVLHDSVEQVQPVTEILLKEKIERDNIPCVQVSNIPAKSVHIQGVQSKEVFISTHTLKTEKRGNKNCEVLPLKEASVDNTDLPNRSRSSLECQLCHFVFKTKRELVNHIGVHNGERRYVCEVCNKGFKKSCILRQHEKIHSGQRPFKCEECDSSFLHHHHLQMHLRVHNGDCPYKCHLCGHSFKHSSNLRKHMKTQHGDKGDKGSEGTKNFDQPELCALKACSETKENIVYNENPIKLVVNE